MVYRTARKNKGYIIETRHPSRTDEAEWAERDRDQSFSTALLGTRDDQETVRRFRVGVLVDFVIRRPTGTSVLPKAEMNLNLFQTASNHHPILDLPRAYTLVILLLIFRIAHAETCSCAPSFYIPR